MNGWGPLMLEVLPLAVALLTAGGCLFGGGYAWAQIKERSSNNALAIQRNRADIENLEMKYDALVREVHGVFKSEAASLRQAMREDVDIIHKRYDKHQEQVTTAINGLRSEIHGLTQRIDTLIDKRA